MNQRFTQRYIQGGAFVAGACTLMIELAASRLLAPFFGTSTIVWANVIATVLIALALGYYVGGRIADRQPHVATFAVVFLIAGTTVAIGQAVHHWALRSVLDVFSFFDAVIVYGSFVSVLLLFAVPLFLLGMISPFAVRLLVADVDKSGQVAGTLSAWATVGSIVGTFGASLVFIPWVGVQETIATSAAALIIWGCLGYGKKWAMLFILLPIAAFLFQGWFMPVDAQLVYEGDSEYQHIRVYHTDDGEYQLVTNEGGGVQSAYHPNRQLTGRAYWDMLGLLPVIREAPKQDAFIIGFAGGTVPMLWRKHVPADTLGSIVGVEIDPGIIDVGKKFFHIDELNADIRIADGRQALASSKDTYDVMIVDAYSQQMYIPFTLTTIEFFHEVKDHLTPHGIVGSNVNGLTTSALIQRFGKTLSSVFPHVYVVHLPGTFNHLFFASQQPIDINDMVDRIPAELGETFARFQAAWRPWSELQTPAQVLTDNRAPVELLTDRLVLQIASQRTRQ